ncbi:unnamed protein product, partial [marine sediment metagenome]
AVHVADALEHEVRAAIEGRDVSRLDSDYLARIGLAERLSTWRELYQAVLQEGVSE